VQSQNERIEIGQANVPEQNLLCKFKNESFEVGQPNIPKQNIKYK